MSSNLLIRRLAVLFGEPKTDDPELFSAEYANALRGVDKAVLQIAGDLIVRERKWRSWPTVADILDVVERAKAMHSAQARVGVALLPIENFDAWWADLIADVRGASSEDQIDRAIAVMEPYWRAKWIANGGQNCRMREIQSHADIRRCVLRGLPIPREEADERPNPERRARVQQVVDDMHQAMASRVPAERIPRPVVTFRSDFEAMQRNSPNRGLHMTRHGLSEISKRIIGDEDDAA